METVTVSEGWRVVIPAAVRAQLNVQQGDQLFCEARDGELVFASKPQRIQRAQALFQQLLPKSKMTGKVVDSFLAERRLEAEREAQETAVYANAKEKPHGTKRTSKTRT